MFRVTEMPRHTASNHPAFKAPLDDSDGTTHMYCKLQWIHGKLCVITGVVVYIAIIHLVAQLLRALRNRGKHSCCEANGFTTNDERTFIV